LITSVHNEHLKEVRRLARRRGRERTGAFVAEGEDLLAAADAAGWPARERYVAAGSGLDGVEVDPAVLSKVSALGSGTRALAVYGERWAAPAGPLCVYLHGVGDPGNVGAVLRAALAFAAGSVVVGPGCADPFGPRAVRASMGAIFSVPVARAAGAAIGGAAAGEATLVVGAEREGLPDDVIAACDRTVHIPIAAESLNAAMAATVALYELTRNRMAAS